MRGDGAEGHAQRAPEAGQQPGPHRVQAGVDHGDDEAELAGEAEAGEAGREASLIALRLVFLAASFGRLAGGWRSFEVFANSLGQSRRRSSIRGRFVDEGRRRLQGRDAPLSDRASSRRARKSGAAMTTPTSCPRTRRCAPGRRGRGSRAAPRAGRRRSPAGCWRAICAVRCCVDVAQQLGVAVAAADAWRRRRSRRSRSDRGEGRERGGPRPAPLPGAAPPPAPVHAAQPRSWK